MNDTLQLPPTREQLDPTVPTLVSEEMKLTVPDGTFAVVVVSETVAVQVETAPMLIDAGAQDTDVEVLSNTAVLTGIVPEVPELPL